MHAYGAANCRPSEERPSFLNIAGKQLLDNEQEGLRTIQTSPPPPQLNGRKRSWDSAQVLNDVPTKRPGKYLRPLHVDCASAQERDPHTTLGLTASERSYVNYWAKEKDWPKEFFGDDSMQRLLAKKKSTPSLRRKRSDASISSAATPSDMQAEKSAPYRNPSYESVLEREAGSYMDKYKLGITVASERLCETLLDNDQVVPTDTIFRDDVFESTCQRLRGRNEARIFKDCTPLIVPSVEALAILGINRDLDIATESVNEGWNNSSPITKPRPQPDYAVGFRRSAFSEDQLKKLQPFLGEPSYSSYFMGTYYLHFPFFTCEVKCGSAGLDIADRQNLHSMTLAVRGVVELYRLVNRVGELHREVLAFSISHDHESIRIYGHFPVIDGSRTTYWRYPLRKFDYTEQKGREKWTAYKFVKNVYTTFMPYLFAKISSALDDLPFNEHVDLSKEFGAQVSEATGYSHGLDDRRLVETDQSGYAVLQQITPDSSMQPEETTFKRKKKDRKHYGRN